MMSYNYVKNYIIICFLVLFPVISTVAQIRLGRYFGNYETLSSASNTFNNCENEVMKHRCYEKCGSNHVCLMGSCVCLETPALLENVFAGELQQEEFVEEKNTMAEKLNDEESPPSVESISVTEESTEKLALRHHIAHFCPNLDEARVCIRQCMQRHLPAFCGKDHICYCGHKDEFSIEIAEQDSLSDKLKNHPFRDIYERFFGILNSNKNPE